jgi:hypothetical protein
MRHPAAATFVLLAGCGRIAFDPLGDGGLGDAAIDVPTGPVRVDELSVVGKNDDHMTLTGDMLEIFFCSDRGDTQHDVYTATRTAVGMPWSTPVRVAELSSPQADYGLGITHDGLTIYMTSERAPASVGDADVFVATRQSRQSAWGVPTRFDAASVTSNEEHGPTPNAAQTVLVFARRVTGSDLFQISRPDTLSSWGAPIALASLNATPSTSPGFHFDSDAHMTSDGLHIIFYSNRSMDVESLFVSQRTSTSQPFDPPVALSMPLGAQDPWLADDLHYMMFVQDAPDGTSDFYEMWLP